MTRIGLRQLSSGLRHRKGAYASLVLEVALGCTVVSYMLGLGRGIADIAHTSLGFDADRTFTVAFEQALDGDFRLRLAREREQLAALPGVEVAAWVEIPSMSRRELPVSIVTARGPQAAWSLRGEPQLAAALDLHVTAGRRLTAVRCHAQRRYSGARHAGPRSHARLRAGRRRALRRPSSDGSRWSA